MIRRKKRSLTWIVVVLVAGVVTGLTLGLLLAVGQDLPQVSSLEDFEPGSVTRILAADGQVLAELFLEKRRPLPLEAIPLALRQAVIAVEDRRFYSHPGLDPIRAVGALLRDIQAGRMIQGGSTITQQLAKNLFLTSEKTLTRKLKELFLALQIERRYTKAEILHLYLNQVYFGAGAYGVAAAAETYFHKTAGELTLDESTFLVGLLQSPEGYSPYRAAEKAVTRRRVVLKAMVRDGLITSAQADRLAATPVRLAARSTSPVKAPFFVQQVQNELQELFGQNAVYKGGLTVETTLIPELQAEAEKILVASLGGPARAGTSAPDRPDRADLTRPRGSLVALKAGRGEVLAWVGGPDFQEDQMDHVSGSPVPLGAAIGPLIHATALESGLTQADRVWDAPVSYQLPGREEPWRPMNASGRYAGEITLRRALETAERIPTVKLLSRVGLDNFLSTVGKLGLAGPHQPDLTIALGGLDASLLEATTAYNTLASDGLWTEPHLIRAVLDRSGRVIHRSGPRRRPALSSETAYIMTDMLLGAVQDGPNSRPWVPGRPVVGVPGDTGDGTNGLFVGFSPEYAVGVWIGPDGRPPVPDKNGPGQTGPGRTARRAWTDFMRLALDGQPFRDFDRPAGVVLAQVDRVTGRACSPDRPGCVSAAFRAGTEPKPELEGP